MDVNRDFRDLLSILRDFRVRFLVVGAHAVAYAYLRNHADAEEATQDAFVKVYQQAHTFDPNQSFRPWFFRILVNHVLNYLKTFLSRTFFKELGKGLICGA